ncbi:MAG: hypothetical protein ABWX84_09120 [Nocardioides sp.]
MAGGMNKRGGAGGIPMSERVRRGPAAPPVDDCPARHCWVSDAADHHGVKRPGLLLEWRQGPSGWEGRVVYAVRVRAAGWASMEEWVPAGLLSEG